MIRYEHFEDVLSKSDGKLEKQVIIQYLQNAESHIYSIIGMENKDSFNTMILIQLQTTIFNMRMKLTQPAYKPKPIDNASTSTKSRSSLKFSKALEETKAKPTVNGLLDIAGYGSVKKQLKAIVILPLRQPQLYVGHKISHSVLLYGPPGTGKTLLAHALAAEANADIYCVTASTIMSSYIGETEKMIEYLFRSLKNVTKTSILFIDEIDGLCRKRHGTEHDHNRRLKTEIMCQLSNFDTNRNAYLLCATNCPWDLDTAFIRRFQKRIYVPLPSRQDRIDLLKQYTRGTALAATASHWDALLDWTEGYSSSDLQDLVRAALMKPIVELEDIKIWKQVDNFYLPYYNDCVEFSENLKFCTVDELPNGSIRTRDVTLNDLLEATRQVKSTVPASEVSRFNDYVINNK